MISFVYLRNFRDGRNRKDPGLKAKFPCLILEISQRNDSTKLEKTLYQFLFVTSNRALQNPSLSIEEMIKNLKN